jgi:hypothetical protein
MKFLINLYYYFFTRQTLIIPTSDWGELYSKGSLLMSNGIIYKVIKNDYKCYRAERLIVCKYKE